MARFGRSISVCACATAQIEIAIRSKNILNGLLIEDKDTNKRWNNQPKSELSTLVGASLREGFGFADYYPCRGAALITVSKG